MLLTSPTLRRPCSVECSLGVLVEWHQQLPQQWIHSQPHHFPRPNALVKLTIFGTNHLNGNLPRDRGAHFGLPKSINQPLQLTQVMPCSSSLMLSRCLYSKIFLQSFQHSPKRCDCHKTCNFVSWHDFDQFLAFSFSPKLLPLRHKFTHTN